VAKEEDEVGPGPRTARSGPAAHVPSLGVPLPQRPRVFGPSASAFPCEAACSAAASSHRPGPASSFAFCSRHAVFAPSRSTARVMSSSAPPWARIRSTTSPATPRHRPPLHDIARASPPPTASPFPD
jgi:hypothetical protein